MNWTERLKEEFLSGWKPFEVVWVVIFLAAQIIAYVLAPDSPLGMISGIAGILCVVLVSKGKISNYFFGLIFAYTYFYVAWGNNFLGEMNTVLVCVYPITIYRLFYVETTHAKRIMVVKVVIAKALTPKGWAILLVSVGVGTFCFVQALKAAGGSSTGLDGLTTIITVAAQLLMILRYREQWLLWIVLNVLSILLWAEQPAMYLMYSAYLLNSLYGYYNWTKLVKVESH